MDRYGVDLEISEQDMEGSPGLSLLDQCCAWCTAWQMSDFDSSIPPWTDPGPKRGSITCQFAHRYNIFLREIGYRKMMHGNSMIVMPCRYTNGTYDFQQYKGRTQRNALFSWLCGTGESCESSLAVAGLSQSCSELGFICEIMWCHKYMLREDGFICFVYN